MIETLLSYGEDAKTSQLTSALFYKDQADMLDSIKFRGANGYEDYEHRLSYKRNWNQIQLILTTVN